jgi:hypothetical protein
VGSSSSNGGSAFPAVFGLCVRYKVSSSAMRSFKE